MSAKRAQAIRQTAARSATLEEKLALRERLEADLADRGIAPDVSRLLVQELEEQLGSVSPERYDALLDGVALACGMGTGAGNEVVRGAAEVREVERMMHSFADELSKLDETLEVLAAYVSRMRSNSRTRRSQVLH